MTKRRTRAERPVGPFVAWFPTAKGLRALGAAVPDEVDDGEALLPVVGVVGEPAEVLS